MALVIARIASGNAETDETLAEALEGLGSPAGEHWTASLEAAGTGSWELVLDGAPRRKDHHIDWEIVPGDGSVRYRKLLQNGERCPDKVRRCARAVVWEAIQFRENPIRQVNPRLAAAFEEAVWRELRAEDMGPLQVRFGMWREGFDGTKYVCKVEYEAVHAPHRPLPWSWWSSLARTPDDVSAELRRALVARRKRQAEAQAIIARTRRQAARRRRPVPAAARAAASRAASDALHTA
ncbi:MAG TPA: hypothetical protein VII13_00495 [Vicinamibacteria bacterium]|jgi:hypothetical protein